MGAMGHVRAWIAGVTAAMLLVLGGLLAAGCGGASGDGSASSAKPQIVVTYPVLGAVVKAAVGDTADVQVLMPNGADPHEWRPSARDVAALSNADLIVQNGLALEGGLRTAIAQARDAGVPVFTATDHVNVRTVRAGEGADPTNADQQAGARDPHIWTDPTQMRAVVAALPAAVKASTGVDISATAGAEAQRLQSLDAQVAAVLGKVPPAARGIVTGHESLGYLARRYGYRLVGAIMPSLSSQGQVSASHLAALNAAMRTAGVRVVFAEIGTPKQVADAVATETGATLVELGTHALPADGSYATFMTDLARQIASALSNTGGR